MVAQVKLLLNLVKGLDILYFNATQWIQKPLFFEITGRSLIKHGNKYFYTALKHNTAAAIFRCELSFNTKLLVILVSHLNDVDLPTVIILRFDLYLQKVIVFVTRGITTLVLL